MYELASTSRFTTKLGTVICVKSPVTAARDGKSMMQAIGDEIIIDGVRYGVRGLEMKMPAYDVFVGEDICILVKELPHE